MQKAARVKKQVLGSFLLLIPLVVVLAIASYAYIKPQVGSYVTYAGPWDAEEFEGATMSFSRPGVAEVTSLERDQNGLIAIEFSALSDGETEATYHIGASELIRWKTLLQMYAIVTGIYLLAEYLIIVS